MGADTQQGARKQMATTYIKGFTRYLVTVTTHRWGTFRDSFWSRTPEQAIAAANRKWNTTTAVIL